MGIVATLFMSLIGKNNNTVMTNFVNYLFWKLGQILKFSKLIYFQIFVKITCQKWLISFPVFDRMNKFEKDLDKVS